MEAVEVVVWAQASCCGLGAMEGCGLGDVSCSGLGVGWDAFVVSGLRRRSRGRRDECRNGWASAGSRR